LSRPACGAGHKKDWYNFAAERRRSQGLAPSLSTNFQKHPIWLSLLNEIRTFFKENPDAEF
jgi:hypothetical protein